MSDNDQIGPRDLWKTRPAPQTPVQAAQLLWEVGNARTDVTDELVRIRREKLPGLRKTHRLAYARKFLGGQGSIEDRKRAAERDTIEDWFAIEAVEQELEACRDELRDLQTRSEELRAINSNLKEELRTLPGHTP